MIVPRVPKRPGEVTGMGSHPDHGMVRRISAEEGQVPEHGKDDVLKSPMEELRNAIEQDLRYESPPILDQQEILPVSQTKEPPPNEETSPSSHNVTNGSNDLLVSSSDTSTRSTIPASSPRISSSNKSSTATPIASDLEIEGSPKHTASEASSDPSAFEGRNGADNIGDTGEIGEGQGIEVKELGGKSRAVTEGRNVEGSSRLPRGSG